MAYLLRGKIIQGDGWGRGLGYPTANLDRRYFVRHSVPEGVWACRVKVSKAKRHEGMKGGGRWLKGVAVIGVKNKVEVHIIDFDKNIYGWYGEAELVKRLRPLQKYKHAVPLITQIKKDITRARKILS